MAKILLFIVLIAIALAWLRAQARRDAPPAAAAPEAPAEAMVTCTHCGLNLPASEAVFDAAGTPFCGAAHLGAHRARQRP
jgi:uncharacterized protein